MSQSSEIEWLPTPPVARSKLTGVQQRLKDIQEALAQKPPIQKGEALVDSKGLNKRTSPVPNDAPAAKKPRQLPPSWKNDDPLSAPSNFTSSSARSSRTATSERSVPAPATISTASSSGSSSALLGKPKKVAAVFLSQEQTQILKLVSEGDSVFYTGSAGTHTFIALVA